MKDYKKPEGSYISFMSNKVKLYGGINLAQGLPGFAPPGELLDILSKVAYKGVHQYAPGSGNDELLNLLVEKYEKFEKEDFLITNGATEAVSLLYTYLNNILDKPYSSLAFEPVYESYKKLPGIFKDEFIPFPLSESGSVDFQRLRDVCKNENTKIIFLNTPGNPLGKIWKREEVLQLLKLAGELNIFVIADAVYQELYFSEKPYNPIEDFNDNLFYVNSFSKIFSITGWRIGYLIASRRHMSSIKSIHDYTGLCAPSVLQEALAEFVREYNRGDYYVKILRNQMKKSFELLKEALEKLGFYIPEIEGGFFIWARLPEKWEDGFQFAMELYEKEQVAVIPGEHFSSSKRNYIRFNIAREQEEIEEAVKRLKRFLNS
ncbi:MAG: pyridoxal phosphate-dependent aminotransferase [Bacteroidota bacterium]